MISIRHIKKSYDGKAVLKDVSFDITPGSIYGLIGINGAGKTTLMNIMTGLSEADSGECEFTDGEKRLKVGYLPDLVSFYDYLNTDEYLDLLLMDKDPAKRDELLSMVSLSKGIKIGSMSRGMRQRLGIAAVLAGDPDVLLLDEPTSALDPAGRADVREIMLNLKSKGKTMILSTHVLADMDSICDRAGFLHNGVIVQEVDVQQNKNTVMGFSVRFETMPDMSMFSDCGDCVKVTEECVAEFHLDESDLIKSQQKIFVALSRMNVGIESIRTTTPDLEQIFKEVIKA